VACHFCHHCQKFDIDLRRVKPDKDGEVEVRLQYKLNYNELRAAALDECNFFSIYFNQVKSHRLRDILQLEVYINSDSMDLIINVQWLLKNIIQEYDSENEFVLFAERGKYPNLPPNIIIKKLILPHQDDLAALYIRSAPFHPEPDDTIKWIRDQLYDCYKVYEKCCKVQACRSGRISTRLIEVGPPDLQIIYLWEISE
jgi:hypothetical protein